MSDDLHPTRLRWDPHAPGKCVARHDGVEIALRRPPFLPGLQNLDELDYAPGACAYYRRAGGPQVEMSREQRAEAMALLRGMAVQGRDAVENGPCLIAAPVQRRAGPASPVIQENT